MEVTQANMEGYADSEFNYNITLNNRTAATQNYSLVASAPTGWGVRFRVRGNYATSVQLEPGDSETLTVNVKSPMRAEAGSYTIDIRAVSGSATAEASLETVIQGEFRSPAVRRMSSSRSAGLVATTQARSGLSRAHSGTATSPARKRCSQAGGGHPPPLRPARMRRGAGREDRKSTRLNSSHVAISYAVFCLKINNIL